MKLLKKIKTSDFIFYASVFILILIAGFRPIGLDADSANYAAFVKSNAASLSVLSKEPGFWLITKINYLLFKGNLTTFFLFFAVVAMSIKACAIKKLSSFPIFALYAYFCLYFILHEMTQIRVAVSVGFFLLAIPDIYNKNIRGYYVKAFLALMFHYSAIVIFFAYFINSRKINFIAYFCLPILGIVLALQSNMMLSFLSVNLGFLPDILAIKIKIYLDLLIENERSEHNIFNFYYSTLIITYYFLLFNYKKLKFKYDILFLKFLGISLFTFYALSFLPVLSFRVSEFFGIVFVFLISNFFTLFKNKLFIFSLSLSWLTIYFIFVALMKNLNA